MDVQHTHRWQNRDVAGVFFVLMMDSALLKKKEKEEGGRAEILLENKVFI